MGKTMALREDGEIFTTQSFSFLRNGHYKKLFADIQHKQLMVNIFGVKHWYDKGYGLAVQTTGRNYRETKQIARILEEKYGRK